MSSVSLNSSSKNFVIRNTILPNESGSYMLHTRPYTNNCMSVDVWLFISGELSQEIAIEMKFPSWLTVGESVMISPYNKTGVVAYLGPTHFAPGPWAGVELDTPTGEKYSVFEYTTPLRL